MANTAKRLASAQLTATAATYYTSPAATKCIVTQIILTNVTGNNATASVSLVNSGGTPGASNRIVEQVAVPAYGVVTLDLKQVLEASDFVSALASAATAVNIRISGVEIV